MNFRAIFSDIQMTTLVVILCQILSSSHMLPISSSGRRSELDLLLDPIYQAEQDVQETKKIVTKSVFSTVLKAPQEQGCPQDMRRVQANGPCVMRYEAFDDSHRLAALREQLQGAFNTNRRKRPNNRNRGSTTPKSTTTTDIPVEVSTLQNLEVGGGGDVGLVDLVDMTSTRLPFVEVTQTNPSELEFDPSMMVVTTRVTTKVEVMQDTGEISNETGPLSSTQLPILNSSDLHIQPENGERNTGVNVTIIETSPINMNIINGQHLKTDAKAESGNNFSTTIPNPTQLTVELSVSPPVINETETGDPTPVDTLETVDRLTTIKPHMQLITAQFENGTKNEEKLVEAMVQNVMVKLSDEGVTTPENFPQDSLIFINNSSEDPGVSLYNPNEESYTTSRIPVFPVLHLLFESKLNQISGRVSSTVPTVIEPLIKTGEETNGTLSAAISSSSPLTFELEALHGNFKGFNYNEIRHDNLMTDISTPAVPDMEELGITSALTLELPMNISFSVNASEIDSTTASPGTPVGIFGKEILAKKIESEDNVSEEINVSDNIFEALSTTMSPVTGPGVTDSSNDDLIFEESTKIKNNPGSFEHSESQESTLNPLHELKQKMLSGLSTSDRIVELESLVSSEIELKTHQEGELHHRSRSRNRIKNPDFSENLQEVHPAVLFHDDSTIRHEELTRDLKSEGRSFINPTVGIGSQPLYQYPQEFVSIDYLRLGDNYRRFRVF